MLIHRLSAAGKRLLPAPLFGAVRRLGNLVLAPALWSYQSGHARSALADRPLTRTGTPVPWYTLPAIDFLAAKDLSGCDVLELGAGNSTLYYGARARSVTAIESDPAWLHELSARVSARTTLHLCQDLATLEARLQGRSFDLIVIDGLDVPGLGRLACAQRMPRYLRPGGAILFDNSDGPWSDDGRFHFTEHFRRAGYSRIDFYGLAPGNLAPSCTSLFFRTGEPCCLLAGTEDPSHR